MLIKWPRGGNAEWKYAVYNRPGLYVEVMRNLSGRPVYSCQMGMPFYLSACCLHNFFGFRRYLTIHFRHVTIDIGIGKAKKHDEVGGTGHWEFPPRTLKNRLHFLFDRCWYGAKDDFAREMARKGMEMTNRW